MDKKTMMENLARESYEKGGFNGTWLYAENGEIVSKGALGFRDPEDTLPITEDTIFQLASVTKQFTAAAVMLARREGLLELDDEILRFLCETEAKPYFAPGEGMHYSNTGYNLLALLVERLSGVPYEDFLQKNIFEPAGMGSTRCCHIRRDGIPFENYAQATVYDDGKCVADIDSAEYGDVVAFDGLNGDDYVYTNIFDMLRWDRALHEGKVLTPEEQKLMYTPGKLVNGEDAVYDEDEGLGYGFGWFVDRDEELGLIVSHSGGMPGVATWLERFIDEDRMLVILTCRDFADVRAYLSFEKGLKSIARGKEPEPVVAIEDIAIKDPDKSKWESFCGKYEHPEDADFIIDEVWMQDGELHAKAIDEDGDEMTFRLYPIGEDEFGRKGGMLKLTFSDDCVAYDDLTCKKLSEY